MSDGLATPTTSKPRVSRNDWIIASIDALGEVGVKGIKVVVVAKKMGVTSGSFYWHFDKLKDLLDAVLDHWEHHLTDHIIKDATDFKGDGDQRILNLMKQVLLEGASEHDHAIAIWARTDPKVKEVYDRTLTRRFEFAKWMFEQAGFAPDIARARGRLMVAYLMGESTSSLRHQEDWEAIIEEQFELILGRERSTARPK